MIYYGATVARARGFLNRGRRAQSKRAHCPALAAAGTMRARARARNHLRARTTDSKIDDARGRVSYGVRTGLHIVRRRASARADNDPRTDFDRHIPTCHGAVC